MPSVAPKAENDILLIIQRLEDEISHRQEALMHLKKAAELIGLSQAEASGPQTALSSDLPTNSNFQIPVSVRVDEFIDQLEPNQEFSLENVVQFVGDKGLEITDKLRANISSVLSRRKGRGIESLVRGQFKKMVSETIGEDAISCPSQRVGDANSYRSPRLVQGTQMSIEKENSHEEM